MYVVAVDEKGSGAVVFGSSPDAALAAQYAKGVGATHALYGSREGDALDAHLVRASDRAAVADLRVPLGGDDLVRAEGRLALETAKALGVAETEEASGRLGAPLTEDAPAYRAFLVGMDLEMSASVLRRDHPDQAAARAKEAIGSYLAAIRADPPFEAAEERALYLVAEEVEHGDTERAVEILEDLVGANPRSWRAHYMLGELRREAGLGAQAVVAFELSDALHPLSDHDRVRLAHLYAESDAPDSAAAHLRRVKPASTHYAEAQADLGAILLAKGDTAGATAALERASASGTLSGDALVRLAQSYAASGDDARARDAFDRALAGDATSAPPAYAAYLHGQGELARALELYARAAERGATAATLLNYARALIVSERDDDAKARLEAVLRSSPDAETAAQARRLRFGLEHPEEERRLEAAGQVAVGADDGDLPAARATLTEVVAVAPDLWEAHFGLGLTARRAGDAAAAEASFRRALALLPQQPDASHELGVALLMQGKLDEAVLALEDAAHQRPNDAGYVADAGFGYMVAGNLHTARTRLERARQLDHEDAITKQYLEELERREAEERH